jgi:hypothetical protein
MRLQFAKERRSDGALRACGVADFIRNLHVPGRFLPGGWCRFLNLATISNSKHVVYLLHIAEFF